MNSEIRCLKLFCTDTLIFTALAAILLTISSFYPFTSKAQAQTGRSAQVLEEIVVSARRRDENLQQVPLSVSAFSSTELELRGVTNMLELNTMLPNLVISGKGPGNSIQSGAFTIRGIGASRDAIIDDPRVAVYIDGMYLATDHGALLDVVNVERIEVLRGPQGTLFGKNALSGAINYVTQEPGEDLAGKVTVTTGRYDRLDVSGYIDLPISDTLLTRIAAETKNADGYGESIVSGREFADIETKSVQGEILWKPSSNFKARFSADFTSLDNNGPLAEVITTNPFSPVYANTGPPFLVFFYNGALGPTTITDATVKASEFENRSTTDAFFKQDIWGVRLNLDWEVNDWLTVKSLTAYREQDLDRFNDIDGTEFVMFEEGGSRDFEQFQQEIQLHGINLDGRLTWVLGGFYFTSEADESRDRLIACDLLPFLPPNLCPVPLQRLFREVDSVAIFGEATYAINDIFSITGGLRWSSEDILDTGSQFGVFGSNEGTFEEVTPRVSLQAQWTDDLMTYFSYSEGFRSGGHNDRVIPTLANNGFLPYEPETLESYEFGIKSQFLEDRLQFNLAIFKQDWESIQVETIPPGNIENFFLNAGTGKADGFELEAVALVGEGLRFNVAVGYTDSGYEQLDAGVNSVTLNTPFSEAPEWTYSIGGQWIYYPSFGGSFTSRVDYGWQDERQLNAGLSLAIQDDSYGLLRARITYKSPSGRWEVSAFGTNLTDERYFLTGLAGAGQTIATAQYGRPIEWGLSLSMNF